MDLSTEYMGLKLKNPIVASSSPLSHSVYTIRRLEDAGVGAVVLYSLFEEQITLKNLFLDEYLIHNTSDPAQAVSYFPDMRNYNAGVDAYLELIHSAREVVNVPIIGSLNGVSTGGWIKYARLIEEAGADALELNVYYLPTCPYMSGVEVEGIYTDILRDVKKSVSIPVAMKLSPYFSSPGNMAQRLVEEGADALVLFNRFYQPDFDLDKMEVTPRLVLSNSHELRLPLCWVGILYGQLLVDFAVSSGVHTYRDVLKSLLAGAKVSMMASELLQNGIDRIGQILSEVEEWMEAHEYGSVTGLIGQMSQTNVAEPAAFERANYMKTLASFHPARWTENADLKRAEMK